MIETSKDLLYIVIAFCVLWLTVFICWALYYFIMILRDLNGFVRVVRERMEKAANIMNFLRNKLFSEGLKGLIALIKMVGGKKK